MPEERGILKYKCIPRSYPLHTANSSFILRSNYVATMPLKTYHLSSSPKGLSSITTLIVGTSEAVLIDPPFLKPDGLATADWVKTKIANKPLKAVFVTHHHPDHFFAANSIFEAFPEAKFYAAPYVLAGINREYDQKVTYWPSVFGAENVYSAPRRPEVFGFSFFVLDGDPDSPVVLLGPLQGDSVDHTLFWLQREKTIICGDAVYGRSTHVWYGLCLCLLKERRI